MRHLGATDAKKTRTSADGGIDVISEKYVAQVKNFSGTVPVESVRELVGVGLVHERIPLFFTSGTYPTGAIEFANKGGVALFVYSAENGTLRPVNAKAKQLFSEGL
jgi:HJR/Mrr/RecB family endonuclease